MNHELFFKEIIGVIVMIIVIFLIFGCLEKGHEATKQIELVLSTIC